MKDQKPIETEVMPPQAVVVREQHQSLTAAQPLTMQQVKAGKMSDVKREWQQNDRNKFRAENGYSKTTHYRFGGIRKAALERDNYSCVKCGMTDQQHRQKWGRPITVDHKDRNEKHNTLENFQTLCLVCHGKKDIKPSLTKPKHAISVQAMANLRAFGKTFREIGILAGIDGSRCRKLILKYQPNTL